MALKVHIILCIIDVFSFLLLRTHIARMQVE
jgi:hypothetical protein